MLARVADPMTTAKLRAAAVALVAAGAAACAPPNASEERDALASWAATIETAIQQWAAGALPTRFTEPLLAEVEGRLAQEARRIQQVETTPDTLAALRQAADSIARIALDARVAVHAGHGPADAETGLRARRLREALQR